MLVKKSILLFFASVFIVVICFSQEHLLSTGDNIVYANVENLIYINLPENLCKHIVLKTDNGKFEKDGCFLKYTPSRQYTAKFQIYRLQHGKKLKIGESVFRVRPLRDPAIHFAGRNNGNMNLEVAKANQGLTALIPGVSCSPDITVDSYSIIVIKNNGSIVTTVNKGGKFDSNASNLMNQLEKGEQLIFSKIITHTPDNVQRHAKPIEFAIN